jgi:glycosyltransferase involved in cell wall biosynthesis
MKTILIIQDGGTRKTRGWNFANALKQKYNVIYLTNFYMYDDVNKQLRKKIINIENISGINVIKIHTLNLPWYRIFSKFLIRLSFSFSLFLAIPYLKKIDVVFACSPHPFTDIFTLFLKIKKHSKVVVDICENEKDALSIFINNMYILSFLNLLLDMILTFILTYSDIIIAHNNSLKNDILKHTSKQVNTITMTVDTDKFRPIDKKMIRDQLPLKIKKLIDEKKFLVMYTGMHGPLQDLTRLIKAVKYLSINNNIYFILAGEGEEKNHLKELVSCQKLNNFIFLDQLPWEKMPYLLNASDLCILPLRDDPSVRLATPAKFFEYAACGKPIIGFCPDGEISFLLKKFKAGVVIPPNDIFKLAQQILLFSNNDELCRRMGNNARLMAVSLYSYKQIGELLDKVIQ